MARHYHTLKSAIGAMSLDYGYNPFAVGQAVIGSDGRKYRKATKTALAALGYPVDSVEAEREDAERRAERDELQRRHEEANAAYDAKLRRDAQRAEQQQATKTVAEQAFAAAGVPPCQCSIMIAGDESGDHTAIVTMPDRKVILERTGDTVRSSKITSVMIGRTLTLRASGRVEASRPGRENYSDPTLGYVLHGRLGEREFWRAVPIRGGADTEHDSRDAAVAALQS